MSSQAAGREESCYQHCFTDRNPSDRKPGCPEPLSPGGVGGHLWLLSGLQPSVALVSVDGCVPSQDQALNVGFGGHEGLCPSDVTR